MTSRERRGGRRRAMAGGTLLGAAVLLAASSVFAQTDQIYFPAVDNVTSVLVSRINAETVRVDMSAWYLTEHAISIALIDARSRGVPVRLIGDRGSIFEIDPKTKTEFYWLASQGVPIRLRYNPNWFPEIDHMKMTVFKGQGLVSFGSANYTPNQLAPASSTDYSDETVMFSTDPALVGAFLTRFDEIWNDTTAEPQSIVSSPPYLLNWNDACAREAACADYATRYPNPAPMSINTARLEPNNPTPANLIWGQGAQFNNRLTQEIDAESSAIKFVIYRLTVDNITNALLARFHAGVPTELIIEPAEYLNRKWPEFWLTHANIDKLWAAGVPIKQRQHAGLTHMKMLVTSNYATNASSNFAANWERDNNYFVSAASKPGVYSAMRNRFDAMWNDGAGFVNFTPQPPDAPALAAPASGATGVSQTATLSWNAAPFAASYDVYLGSSSSSLVFVGNVPAQLVQNPPATYSWTASSALVANATYYWKVVARTNATVRDAALVAGSATWSFVTGSGQGAGTTPSGGTGGTPFTIYRRSNSQWWVKNWPTGIAFGAAGDIPVAGDYDGDGRMDLAVWRPSDGTWHILPSTGGYSLSSERVVQWGYGPYGDVPVPGDYDGDGKTDLAIWRPSTGEWWILLSTRGYNRGAPLSVQWGAGVLRDVPVPADYDGDGKTDIAVWRQTTGEWYILKSSQGFNRSSYTMIQWGNGVVLGDVPVPADYDGDGKADLAVWRPSSGDWFLLKSSQGYNRSTYATVQWGAGILGDVPIPGDYDGDGKADIAVWRPSTGDWWVLNSSDNYNRANGYSVQWGAGALGDMPATGTIPLGSPAFGVLKYH